MPFSDIQFKFLSREYFRPPISRRAVLASGISLGCSVLAGCQENESEPDHDPFNPPPFFEVTELEPGNETITRGNEVEIRAIVTNVPSPDGGQSGRQEVTFQFAGKTETTESRSYDDGESRNVSREFDTAERDPGEYEYTVSTEDDELTATLLIESAREEPNRG